MKNSPSISSTSNRCSPWLDLRIFLLTIWQVLTRRGVNQPGHVTMEKFAGSAL